jgi:hypothetical protein
MSDAVKQWIDGILLQVSGLRDNDNLNMMQVSDHELRVILEEACEDINLWIE